MRAILSAAKLKCVKKVHGLDIVPLLGLLILSSLNAVFSICMMEVDKKKVHLFFCEVRFTKQAKVCMVNSLISTVDDDICL